LPRRRQQLPANIEVLREKLLQIFIEIGPVARFGLPQRVE
jgi:hypothetical protein